MRPLLLVPFLALLLFAREANAQLCEATAIAPAVENAINSLRQQWPRGEVNVVGPIYPSDGIRRLSDAQFQDLQQTARGGYIVIRELQAPINQPGGFSLDKMMTLSLGGGTIAKYDVQPGSIRSDSTYSESHEAFGISAGIASATKVVRAESLAILADRYCLAYATFTYRLKEMFRSRFAAFEGGKFSESRKGRVLLKLDPFTNKWTFVAGDFSNADKTDFSTHTVPQALNQGGMASGVGQSVATPAPTSQLPPGPIPNQTDTGPVNSQIAKAFFAQGGDKLGGYTFSRGTVIVSNYALQRWRSTIENGGGGDAVLEHRGSQGWVVLGLGGGGPTDVAIMMSIGVPKEIAQKLKAGSAW